MDHDALLVKIVQAHGITPAVVAAGNAHLVALDGGRVKDLVHPVRTLLCWLL